MTEQKRRKLKFEYVRTDTVQHKRRREPVEIKVYAATLAEVEPRAPKPLHPCVLVPGRKLNPPEFLDHLMGLTTFNPQGFRQPSSKAKNWTSTSLAEKAAIAAGLSEVTIFERSERGLKKLEARNEAKARIILDRLIAQWPDRREKARTNEQMVSWFVAAVEQEIEDRLDREWITNLVQKRIKDGFNLKHLHSHARRQAKSAKFKEAA